jgi:hypothetical protein
MKKAILASMCLLAFTMAAFGQTVGCKSLEDRFRSRTEKACFSTTRGNLSDHASFVLILGDTKDLSEVGMSIYTSYPRWVASSGMTDIDFLVDGKPFNFRIIEYSPQAYRYSVSETFRIRIPAEVMLVMGTAQTIEMRIGLHEVKFPGEWVMIFNLALSYFEIKPPPLPDSVPISGLTFEKALGLIPHPKPKCAKFWECEP